MSLRVEVPTRATVNESYGLVKACVEAESAQGPVTFDCSKTTMFGPFGVVVLASSVLIRRRAQRETSFLWPEDEGARGFLDEVGLPRFARGENTGYRTLELRQLDALDARYAEDVAGLLSERVEGMTRENSYPVQLSLNELLQNVFEWSESPVGCVVLTRWYKTTGSVRLAVADRGIGIAAALRKGQTADLHRASDADVIEAAVTRPRLTSRANRVGGLGLKTLHGLVADRGGSMTALAQGGKVRWHKGRTSKYSGHAVTYFRGTAVEVEFRPEPSRRQGPSEIEVF